jgi:hypothetical protein
MNDVSAPGAETPEQRAIEIRGPVCARQPCAREFDKHREHRRQRLRLRR